MFLENLLRWSVFISSHWCGRYVFYTVAPQTTSALTSVDNLPSLDLFVGRYGLRVWITLWIDRTFDHLLQLAFVIVPTQFTEVLLQDNFLQLRVNMVLQCMKTVKIRLFQRAIGSTGVG